MLPYIAYMDPVGSGGIWGCAIPGASAGAC